jgi:C-terminal processing protease CtpA/Prc
VSRQLSAILILIACCCGTGFAQLTAQQKAENLNAFETVWSKVRDRHPDPRLNGLDWQKIHDSTRPLIEKAQSMDEVRRIMREMLARLESSHYAIIPADRYAEPAGTGTKTPDAPVDSRPREGFGQISPEGVLVKFGNLPETRLSFDAHALADGVGYIRFNEFLEPGSIMPQIEEALKKFHEAPGVILDIRGNPGGIGIMAMGIAGFFIDKTGQSLGEMTMRDTKLKFVIFPRPQVYKGPLAILVDGGSASTSEILAGGMQDLKRARIFGTRTAGAVLPSDIVRLPNGDGFQYAQAGYKSTGGRVLEGTGVTPDLEVRQTEEARRAGKDLVVDAADEWIRGQHQ